MRTADQQPPRSPVNRAASRGSRPARSTKPPGAAPGDAGRTAHWQSRGDVPSAAGSSPARSAHAMPARAGRTATVRRPSSAPHATAAAGPPRQSALSVAKVTAASARTAVCTTKRTAGRTGCASPANPACNNPRFSPGFSHMSADISFVTGLGGSENGDSVPDFVAQRSVSTPVPAPPARISTH